jgi:GNAT superfamily N-acetyltransferase
LDRTDIALVDAYDGPPLEEARGLIVAYADSLPFALDFQELDRELAELPGAYAPPAGRLLLARADAEPVGCIALRPFGAHSAELKRLYVRPAGRGTGAGRRLAEAAVAAARELGYARVLLDTTPGMDAAQALYRSLGFAETEPYRLNPIAGATFLELRL